MSLLGLAFGSPAFALRLASIVWKPRATGVIVPTETVAVVAHS